MRNPKKVLKILIVLTVLWLLTNALSVYISYNITMFSVETLENGVPAWATIIYFLPLLFMIIWLCFVAWYFYLKDQEAKRKKKLEHERQIMEAALNVRK